MEASTDTDDLLRRLIALEEAHLAAYTKASGELNALQARYLANQERAMRQWRRVVGVVFAIVVPYFLWYAYSMWTWYTHGGGKE